MISLLLPALNRARAASQVVNCAAKLHQIAIASRAYAVDNRDHLPPWPLDRGSPYFDAYDRTTDADYSASTTNASGQQIAMVRSAWPYWMNASTGTEMTGTDTKNKIGANIGRLCVAKYLGSSFEAMANCPTGFTGTPASSLYLYNPHMAYRTAPNGTMMKQTWFKTTSSFGRGLKGSLTYQNVGTGAKLPRLPTRQPCERSLSIPSLCRRPLPSSA